MVKRQDKAAATRRQLVEAAEATFAAKGYVSTSVSAITRLANTAHGTFYLYFRNKEDVFDAVMAEVLDDLYEHSFTPISDMGPGYEPDRNRDRITSFLEHFAAHGPLWRALLEAVLASPTIEARWLELRARFHREMAERIRLFQRSGQMRDMDPDRVAVALCGMLEWYAMTGAVFESPGPLDAGADTVSLISNLWQGALGVLPPSSPAPGAPAG